MFIIVLWIGSIVSTTACDFDAKPMYQKEVASFEVNLQNCDVIASPDHKTLLITDHNNQAELWTIDGRKIATLKCEAFTQNHFCFSADGTKIHGSGVISTYQCWDASTGQRLVQQFAIEDEISLWLTSLAWRLFEPVKMPNETNEAFQLREGAFGSGMGFVMAILHPWANVPLGISDSSQHILSCMTYGGFPFYGTPLVQLWDIKEGRPGRIYMPSAWPLTILDCCRSLDRIEAYVVPLCEMVRSCFPAFQGLVVNHPSKNNIPSFSNPLFDESSSKWYIRFFDTAIRWNLQLPIAEHFSLFSLEGASGMTLAPSAFSRDGRWFAHCFGSPCVRIWDLTTGHAAHVLPKIWANQIQFDSTGKTLLIASGEDNENKYHLSRLDLEKKRSIWSKVMPKRDARKIEISNDDRLAVVTHHLGGITVWNLDDGRLLEPFNQTKRRYNSATFLENGKKLVTTLSLDDQRTRIQIWK